MHKSFVSATLFAGAREPLNSILVKPSGSDCTLGYTYCLFLDRARQTLERQAHRVSETSPEQPPRLALKESEVDITYMPRDGEPTLMGFFRAFRHPSSSKKEPRWKKCGNVLQTIYIMFDEE